MRYLNALGLNAGQSGLPKSNLLSSNSTPAMVKSILVTSALARMLKYVNLYSGMMLFCQ